MRADAIWQLMLLWGQLYKPYMHEERLWCEVQTWEKLEICNGSCLSYCDIDGHVAKKPPPGWVIILKRLIFNNLRILLEADWL